MTKTRKAEDLINELKEFAKNNPGADIESEAVSRPEDYLSGREWASFWNIMSRMTYTSPYSSQTHFYGEYL